MTPKLPDLPDLLDLIPSGAPRNAKSRQVNGMENFLLSSTSAPEVGSPFSFICIIYSKKGETSHAVEVLEGALKNNPPSEVRGKILVQLNQIQ